MKRCKGECKKIKELSEFGIYKFSRDGFRYECKDCVKKYDQKYAKLNKIKIAKRKQGNYEKNKDKRLQKTKEYYINNKNKRLQKTKEYYINNKNKRLQKTKEYYINNKDKISKKRKEYRANNKEKEYERHKKYHANNKEKINKYNKHYRNERKRDPFYRLPRLLRARLCSAIKNNYKSGSAIRDLGCSIEELKIHLESQFKKGMNWENHCYYGWHIDHIRPLASFDLANREQLLKACHYTNLQPLWAKDNLRKSNN